VVVLAQVNGVPRDQLATFDPPRGQVFVGNLSAGGERFVVATVVFKKGAPDTLVKEVYDKFVRLYTITPSR
jgi:hypothetical protein